MVVIKKLLQMQVRKFMAYLLEPNDSKIFGTMKICLDMGSLS